MIARVAAPLSHVGATVGAIAQRGSISDLSQLPNLGPSE
jgi:hypothetical protein